MIENCVVVVGFSVGEFVVLVFVGVMEFVEGLYVVKIWVEVM